ncbi:MAG: hypothetical protein K2X77_08340 [Candidatus Obscuribacterales bacterium]|nr:hypothetical protein [Candidatus Obscuribacterales bacterium]
MQKYLNVLLFLMLSNFGIPIVSTIAADGTKASLTLKRSAHPTSMKLIEPGVFDVPLVLSKSLEPRRSEFRQNVIDAQKKLRAFAKSNAWEQLTDKPLIKRVEVYDTKDGWDNRLRQFYPKEAPKVIPKTFSAAIEKDIFFAVSPDVYLKNYPDGKDEPRAFEKLITHELAHRLHVRICKGDESKMGPIWFWEGFAVYAADQLNYNRPNLSEREIWNIVDAKERGSYRKYNVVFRHFLKKTDSLSDYVSRAGKPDFMQWLKKESKEG